MRRGALFEDFRAAFGQDDPDRLVWKASSLLTNPTLKPERLERERRLDPSRFEREFEAAFAPFCRERGSKPLWSMGAVSWPRILASTTCVPSMRAVVRRTPSRSPLLTKRPATARSAASCRMSCAAGGARATTP